MQEKEISDWLDKDLPNYEKLTATAARILETVLLEKRVQHLPVAGRTKTRGSIFEKIRRKGYADPKKKLIDISGIRVIVYLESQVERVSKLIEKAFDIDKENSYTRDSELSIDQIGYRSVHYVCRLGLDRTRLLENEHLSDMYFEIQVRTVLQHAWAELDHDQRYKFAAKLPRDLERELFLYAGLLEIADNGFSTLADKINTYVNRIKKKTKAKQYDIELNSLSLEHFVESWCNENGFHLEKLADRGAVGRKLVIELRDYGLNNIDELRQIIPIKYAKTAKKLGYKTTTFGLLRDWMILHDYERYRRRAWKKKWSGWSSLTDPDDEEIQLAFYHLLAGPEVAKRIFRIFNS